MRYVHAPTMPCATYSCPMWDTLLHPSLGAPSHSAADAVRERLCHALYMWCLLHSKRSPHYKKSPCGFHATCRCQIIAIGQWRRRQNECAMGSKLQKFSNSWVSMIGAAQLASCTTFPPMEDKYSMVLAQCEARSGWEYSRAAMMWEYVWSHLAWNQ